MRQNMAPLAFVVLFVTVLAPLVRLPGDALCADPRPRATTAASPAPRLRHGRAAAAVVDDRGLCARRLCRLCQAWRPCHDRVATGVYALFALTIVLVWLDSALDREAVWERLDHADRRDAPPCGGPRRLGRLRDLRPGQRGRSRFDGTAPAATAPCTARRPNSIQRTWALVIAAAILYVPANYYPVLSIVQLGAGQPSTILGGVEELVAGAPVSARRPRLFRQHRGAVAETRRPVDHADCDPDRARRLAARPHPALSHRAVYRPLVDDRHLSWSRCSARWSCLAR